MGVMTVTELDSSALRSTVAFTGRLACMTRAEAFEVVRSHGGTPSQTVTRQTNVLVVGELGWPLLDDGRRKLGTIFPTCWTSRAGQKPQSIVCTLRSEPRRTMPTRCSILRYCYSEATSTQRRRSTGGAISPRTANLNGQHGRAGP